MSKKRDPWMKFFPTDWRSDPRLRMCSPAARGLWIDMLCLMHEAEPYGHLLVSGVAPSDTQLSMLTATPAEQLPDLKAELEDAGVFSRNGKGVIYSRRMTRDEKRRQIARRNGKSGGNPSLSKIRENKTQDNQTLIQPDNGEHKAQKPEARGQRPEDPPLIPPRGDDPPPKKSRPKLRFDDDLGVPDNVAAAYVEHRRKKRSPPTEHAMALLSGELRKIQNALGHKPEDVVNHAISKGWTGFKASWDYSDLGAPPGANGRINGRSPPDRPPEDLSKYTSDSLFREA